MKLDTKNLMKNKKLNEGKLLQESIFATEPNILNTKYSINKPFLYWFLNYIDPIINKNLQDIIKTDKTQNLTKIFSFLNFYKINFSTLYQKTLGTATQDLTELLINYALYFDSENEIILYTNLKTRIENIENLNIKTQYKNYLNMIAGYKRNFIGTIKHALIYANFEYFIVPSYMDFRGRVYNKGVYLNIQSYVFISAFVCLYETPATNSKEILKKVKTSFTNKEVLADFEKIEESFTEEYIDNEIKNFYKLCIKDEYIEEFSHAYDNPKNNTGDFWFPFLSDKIKDAEKLINLVSYILLEKRDKSKVHYSNAYSLDASNSGYQMMAILFRSKNIGELCNLDGTIKADIYAIVISQFKNLIEKGTQIINLFLKHAYDSDIDSFCKIIKERHDDTKNTQIQQFNFTDKTPMELLKYILTTPKLNRLPDFFIMLNTIINDNNCQNVLRELSRALSSLDWLLNKNNMYDEYLNNTSKGLFICYEFIKFQYYVSLNPYITDHNILFNRKCVKSQIMTHIYGCTSISRKENWVNYFIEEAMRLGIVEFNLYAIHPINNKLDNFFRMYVKNNLSETLNLGEIAKFLCPRKTDGILIINDHLKILQAELSYTSHYKRIHSRKVPGHSSFRISLQRPNIIFNTKAKTATIKYDYKSMRSHFPPNFIHSMDASIVHDMRIKWFNLNKEMQDIPFIFTLYTNHDSFSVGRTLYVALPFLLRDCYISIYNYDYLNTLKPNIKNPKLIKPVMQKIKLYCNNEGSPNYLPNSFINPHFFKKGL